MSSESVQIPDITKTPAWNALVSHHDQVGTKTLRELFKDDSGRGRESPEHPYPSLATETRLKSCFETVS